MLLQDDFVIAAICKWCVLFDILHDIHSGLWEPCAPRARVRGYNPKWFSLWWSSAGQALLDLKTSITGDPTGFLKNWTTSSEPCTWTGVACCSIVGPDCTYTVNTTLVQHVQSLALGDYSGLDLMLEGSLPPTLNNLKYLDNLDVSHNRLSGPLPSLPNMSASYLNQFTGLVPQDFVSSSITQKLVALDLSSNRLTGPCPTSLFASTLQYLNISGNSFNGSVPSLANCTSIASIDVSNNGFTGQVGTIGSVMLSKINLNDNHFTGPIPASLVTDCPTLYSINLQNNSFSGSIPADLLSLLNQTIPITLNLADNNLSGPVPTKLLRKLLANAAQIDELYLNANQISMLNVSNNNLMGAVKNVSNSNFTFSYAGNVGLCGASGLAACSSPAVPHASPPVLQQAPMSPASAPAPQPSSAMPPHVVSSTLALCLAVLVWTSTCKLLC
eukprot:SM000120S25692  [mRNA]  locus=s120:162791:166600:- [translate_table: standard]